MTASLTGTVSKIYDGNTDAANLTDPVFQLTGLVGNETATITRTTGSYASKDVGTGIEVSTTLSASDFTELSGFLKANYNLPTSAKGNIGTITQLLSSTTPMNTTTPKEPNRATYENEAVFKNITIEVRHIGVTSMAMEKQINTSILTYVRALREVMISYNADGLKIIMDGERLYIAY